MKRRPQVPDEGKDSELWHATRRRFLQVSALAGTLLSVDLLRPSKKVSFAIEGDLTPTDMRVKAMKVFGPPTFFMWSQATLAVGQEKAGKRDWEVVKAMGALGGGLGGNGELCGALIGALATLGLKFSRASEEEKENPIMFGYAIEFFKRFRSEIVQNHSGIRCREITGLDFSKPEDVQTFYKGEKFVECTRIVGDTAKLVGEFLERRT